MSFYENSENNRHSASFNEEDWLTPREAAAYIGVSVSSIYAWIARGLIESTVINKDKDKRGAGVVRVSRANVELLHQRKNIRKVAGEVVDELTPQADSQRKREVSSAVFVALAGMQNERQQLVKQLIETQSKAAKDAYELGQLEEKLALMSEMEEIITYLRKEINGLQSANRRLLNLMTILGVGIVVLVFALLVCVVVLIR